MAVVTTSYKIDFKICVRYSGTQLILMTYLNILLECRLTLKLRPVHKTTARNKR